MQTDEDHVPFDLHVMALALALYPWSQITSAVAPYVVSVALTYPFAIEGGGPQSADTLYYSFCYSIKTLITFCRHYEKRSTKHQQQCQGIEIGTK